MLISESLLNPSNIIYFIPFVLFELICIGIIFLFFITKVLVMSSKMKLLITSGAKNLENLDTHINYQHVDENNGIII